MKISIWLELKMVKGNVYSIPEWRDNLSPKFWKGIREGNNIWEYNSSSRNMQNVLKTEFLGSDQSALVPRIFVAYLVLFWYWNNLIFFYETLLKAETLKGKVCIL